MGQLKMAKRKKITAPVVATPTLDGFVDAQMVALHEAINQGDSLAALRATFLALQWRSVRLATVLGIVPESFDFSLSWEPMARVLRGLCLDAVESHVHVEGEEANYKFEVIAELLDAMLEVSLTLGSGTVQTGEGALRLVLGAGLLGRCEMMLGFAEEGFWEQVYQWRCQHGGKPPGSGLAPWKEKAAVQIKSWIDENPLIKPTPLIRKLHKWLCANGYPRDFTTAKTGYYEMQKAGDFKLPDKEKR